MRRWGRAGRTGHVDSLAATVASAAVLLLAGCAAPPGTSPSDPAPTGVETTASPQPSATGEPSSTPGEPTAEPSATADADAAPTPPPTPARPLSAAGGACHLLDYATLYDHLGLPFDVAAARSRKDAHACVVRATAPPSPALALTVVPTSADLESFELDLMPEDADEVERLGRMGYVVAVEPVDDRGPGLEVGWLSADGRLVTLALTMPKETDADPTDYADGLIEVARTVDRRRI